jgi:uncharacterized protein
MNKRTLVIGASNNPGRYSYKAVSALTEHGHDAVPLGIKKGDIEGIVILNGTPELKNINTVTLYLNSLAQQKYYDYIMDLAPQRVIFNPGTENPAFQTLCEENGIQALEACTLVMLATNQY